VREAVGDLAAFDGLDEGGRRGLPLGAACAGARTGHLALRYCHGYLFSVSVPLQHRELLWAGPPVTAAAIKSICLLKLFGVILTRKPVEASERSPPWIDGRFVLVTGVIEQSNPTLRAQTEAIVLADRLERQ
jgi:hypothetical protein